MPVISDDKFKYFQPQEGLSSVRGAMVVPGVVSVPSEAQSAGARVVMSIGDELEKMGAKIGQARVKDDIARYTLSALGELSDAEREVVRTGDYRTAPSRFRDKMDEIRARYDDLAGVDPEVRSGFAEKFGYYAESHLARVQTQSWRRELDQQQAGVIDMADKTLKMIGRSASPAEAAGYRNDFLATVQDKANDGLLDASWAAHFRIAWEKEIGVMQVRRGIERSPEAMLEKLEGKDPAFAFIGEDTRLVLLKEARAAVRARQIEQKSALETGVYQSLFDRFNGDTEAMRSALMDPKEMKAYGITLENAKSIENAVSDLEKQKKADMRIVQVGYLQDLIQGKLTETRIAEDVRNDRISPELGEHWLEQIQRRNERIDPFAQASEIVSVNAMISRGYDPDTIRDYVLGSKNLKKEDKEQYLGKLDQKLGREMEEGRKLGYREIESLITPKRGAMAEVLQTTAEAVAVSKGQMAFDDWIDQQRKQGKTPGLNEMRRKAISLGEAYQVPLAEKVENKEAEARQTGEEMKRAAERKLAREKEAKRKGLVP